MTRKSSRSSLINPVAVGCGIALALCFHFGQVTHTQAQQPTPSQAPAAKPRKAHIRFWNLLPAGPTNDLQLFAGNGESISGAAPNDVYTGYLPAPDGSYVLTVKRVGGKSAVIWRQPVVLPVNGFITLIASEKNGQPTAEMFNDTPDPNVVESTARIVVRQFCPGAHVKVSVAGGPSTQTLEYGDTSTLENIPLADHGQHQLASRAAHYPAKHQDMAPDG